MAWSLQFDSLKLGLPPFISEQICQNRMNFNPETYIPIYLTKLNIKFKLDHPNTQLYIRH